MAIGADISALFTACLCVCFGRRVLMKVPGPSYTGKWRKSLGRETKRWIACAIFIPGYGWLILVKKLKHRRSRKYIFFFFLNEQNKVVPTGLCWTWLLIGLVHPSLSFLLSLGYPNLLWKSDSRETQVQHGDVSGIVSWGPDRSKTPSFSFSSSPSLLPPCFPANEVQFVAIFMWEKKIVLALLDIKFPSFLDILARNLCISTSLRGIVSAIVSPVRVPRRVCYIFDETNLISGLSGQGVCNG